MDSQYPHGGLCPFSAGIVRENLRERAWCKDPSIGYRARAVENCQAMELGRMDVERKLACNHCRKLLPDFHPQEIVEADQYPLRCPECRQIVQLAPEYVEQVRRKLSGD